MKLLLDTHAAIWWWTEPDRIGPRCGPLLSDRSTAIYFSAASAYELAQKQRWRGAAIPSFLLEDLPAQLDAEGWTVLPISLDHATQAGLHASTHRDPFDRLLAAQAEVEGLTLVTCDPAFGAFGTRTLW